jgi:hypothetical protein
MWRAIYWMLVFFVPSAALGADTPAGVIYGNGTVYVNGEQLTNSSAVMVGDVVQTKEAGVAQLNAVGSSMMLQSNTIVRFRDGGLALDRGTVTMATGKGSTVFARDFKISPVSTSWTQFDVIRTSGVIQIFARKGDLSVSCGAGAPVAVKEGHQLSRDDAEDCGLVQRQGGAAAAAKGPILASPLAEKVGIATAGGLLGWVLFHNDEPVSPFVP